MSDKELMKSIKKATLEVAEEHFTGIFTPRKDGIYAEFYREVMAKNHKRNTKSEIPRIIIDNEDPCSECGNNFDIVFLIEEKILCTDCAYGVVTNKDF